MCTRLVVQVHREQVGRQFWGWAPKECATHECTDMSTCGVLTPCFSTFQVHVDSSSIANQEEAFLRARSSLAGWSIRGPRGLLCQIGVIVRQVELCVNNALISHQVKLLMNGSHHGIITLLCSTQYICIYLYVVGIYVYVPTCSKCEMILTYYR